jgi:hypothetical protein
LSSKHPILENYHLLLISVASRESSQKTQHIGEMILLSGVPVEEISVIIDEAQTGGH